MEAEFKAWAIHTKSNEGHGFIGRYFFCFKHDLFLPPNLEGCQVSLFKTRKIAREYLPEVRFAFPNAKVVKVKVGVTIGQ